MKYLHEFDTVNDYNEMRFGEEYEEPWVSLTNENTKVNYNMTEEEKRQKPLTFEITGNGNIYWKAKSGTPESGLRTIEYKKNNDEWKTITSSTGGVSITVSSGDTVLFRAPQGVTYTTLSDTYEKANFFSGCTCAFNVKGNVMSLLNANNFSTMSSLTASLVFTCLFRYCTGLTDASKLILPADNLTFQCYRGMFANCSNLVGVPKLPAMNLGKGCYNGMFQYCYKLTDGTMLPELPATTLASNCYDFMFASDTGLTDASELVLPATTLASNCYASMFWKCTSLRTAPELPATTLANSCYYQMFQGCTSLTQAPELPVTALTDHCYYQMFQGCTSLTQAPELPATTLANNCYELMFSGCTSLTTAPSLPATTLAYGCYSSMFYGCTNLTTAPSILPATTLADSCYGSMFQNCTSLTTAPQLPATTLANNCYEYMFQNCRSLTTAPSILPATTLIDSCYHGMFSGCTSLNYIKCLATNISASNCTVNWVSGVSRTGTFVKNPSMTSWSTGTNGIPTGWTVQDA